MAGAGGIFAEGGDICTDQGGGVCLSTAGGGGSGLWSQSGSDIYYDNGNVGIGKDDPGAYKLWVQGDLRVNGSVDFGVSSFRYDSVTDTLTVGNIAPGNYCDENGLNCVQLSALGGGLSCTTRTASGTTTVTVVCIGSEIITGGGCRPQSGAWVQSAYFSGNNYVCSGIAAGGTNVAVTAYARCCQ